MTHAPESLTDRLWKAVTSGDELTAADTAIAALDGGLDIEDLLLDVIAPLQGRVGNEWAANRFSVAQEHLATAVNERVISALAYHPSVRERQEARRRPGRVAVACIDGEWHALPARLVTEILRLRGWHVDYLGAQVPTEHLVAHLHGTGPAVIALSSSIATRLPAAHAAIVACRATGTPVMVGGAAFGPAGRYVARLGADAWAADARAAAERLAEGPPPKPPAVHRQVIDDLPHLADLEYAHVSRTAPHLVRHVMTGLASRFPAMAAYSERQRHHTAEDVAHIVGFLGAALYVDDPDLFSGFMAWVSGLLTARNVPTYSLLPSLELLSEQLQDHPRAIAVLARAHAEIQNT
ncbi:B12-binding domain-containing protein [Actinomadura sp. 9N407]|uniref:B12-binding domain-containing protein n=1 Tax=Actinomadura sp. 9N407 TaxID=3375154 RepID=UPI0037B6103A